MSRAAKGKVAPSGASGMVVIRKNGKRSYQGAHSIMNRVKNSPRDARVSLRSFWEETKLYTRILRNAVIRPFGGPVAAEARLYALIFRANGDVVPMGLIGTKVVTTVGVNFLVDGLQSSATDVSTFNFHDSGTGNTAEAIGDTALVTKVETGRATGVQGEGASANIYQTVATISYTATRSIVEHGIFSASTGGTLLDRTVFTSIGVDNGDSIQFTYELTLPAGS